MGRWIDSILASERCNYEFNGNVIKYNAGIFCGKANTRPLLLAGVVYVVQGDGLWSKQALE